jgi:hypothetical protein
MTNTSAAQALNNILKLKQYGIFWASTTFVEAHAGPKWFRSKMGAFALMFAPVQLPCCTKPYCNTKTRFQRCKTTWEHVA